MERRSRMFRSWIILLLGMCAPAAGKAEHFVGGSITYQWISGNSYDFIFDFYTSCATLAVPGNVQELKFSNSCGVFFLSNASLQLVEEVSPLCASQINQSTCHSGGTLPGYKRWRYRTGSVYMSPCNYWTIYYQDCCREFSQNLVSQPNLYVEATLNNLGGRKDNSPIFNEHTISVLCSGQEATYNAGVSDPDGNPIVFSLISSRLDAGVPQLYQPGFSGTSPIPGIGIDPLTGQIWFNTAVTGKYVVVIQATTYDSVTGQLIGSVMRDMIYIVAVCDNSPPIPAPAITVSGSVAASGSHSIALCNGQSFCADLVITDANNLAPLVVTSNASTVLPGATFTVTGTNPVTGRLCWTANTAVLPTNVFITIDDGACPISNQASSSIFLGNCALLPVELLGFAAIPENSAVVVRWSTTGEVMHDHFLVERSKDGVLFKDIGRVEGVGITNGLNDYVLKDDYPLAGTSYYRLRQVDHDGTATFGPIVPVEFGANARSVHAVRQGTNGWSVMGLDAEAMVTLTDAVGRVVNLRLPGSIDQGVWIESMGNDQMLILTVTDRDGRQVLRLPPVASDGTVVAARGTE